MDIKMEIKIYNKYDKKYSEMLLEFGLKRTLLK